MSATDVADGDVDLLVVGEVNPDMIVWDADPRPVFGQAERFVEGIRLTIGSSSAITACGAARLGLVVEPGRRRRRRRARAVHARGAGAGAPSTSRPAGSSPTGPPARP